MEFLILFRNLVEQIYKTNEYLNYLAKFAEQHFSKTHFDASSESAKNSFLWRHHS
jgi:hypothetical protein